ncbi:MAG: hypothetical protein LQ340_002531, partial [Diploschistes diacapsis]
MPKAARKPTRYSSPDELAGSNHSSDEQQRYNRRRSGAGASGIAAKAKDAADSHLSSRRSGRNSKSTSYDDLGADASPARIPRDDEESPDELDHT